MFRNFIAVEIFFIIWLTFEICLAFFVSVHMTFFTSWLNLLDVCLVGFSFWSVSASTGRHSLRALRVIRVLRVARRLLKYGFLRTILTSLYKSFSPVLHVFILTFIMMSLYALLAVSLFEEVGPFSTFSKALFSVSQLATMEGWVDIHDELLENSTYGGELGHWIVRGYVISYIVIVAYVMLNIVIAALLDSFIASRQDEDKLFRLRQMHIDREPLDSLLQELAATCNDQDLNQQLNLLFVAFLKDKEHAGALTFESMSEGLSRLNLNPRIYFGLDDYMIITHQLTLCRPDGSLTKLQFEHILLQQLRAWILRNMRNAQMANGADGADQTDDFGLVMNGINHLLFDTQKLLYTEPTPQGDHRTLQPLSPREEALKEAMNEVRGDVDVLQIESAQDVFIENCHIDSRLQAVEQQMRDMKDIKSIDSRMQAMEHQMRDMNMLLARLAGASLPAHSCMCGITSGGVETRNGAQTLNKELCKTPNQDKSTVSPQIWSSTFVSSGGALSHHPSLLDVEKSHLVPSCESFTSRTSGHQRGVVENNAANSITEPTEVDAGEDRFSQGTSLLAELCHCRCTNGAPVVFCFTPSWALRLPADVRLASSFLPPAGGSSPQPPRPEVDPKSPCPQVMAERPHPQVIAELGHCGFA